ncbi:MAG: ATP-binding protein [Oscillospiraceae bacterium]|nr:ATP-binding protein [Oscillospiraceae bacterium]
MKNLPFGLQSFRNIIEGDFVYVDKTKYVYDIISINRYYFLSRPRRFGKSLLLDTIAEAFSGERELFKGLYLDSSDYAFVKHPVIRFDMSNISNDTAEILTNSLIFELESQIKREGLFISNSAPPDMFKELIRELHKKYNKQVVILIDEYDNPILDHLMDEEKAQANRTVIRDFYKIIKSMSAHIRLVFITGVSKFSKTSIFSALNNLNDITLSEEYANVCGITLEDLDKYFSEHIEHVSKLDIHSKFGCLKKQILKWYDGYSWDGETRVINPFSLLGFLLQKRFKGYWYETGTPTFLLKILKEKPDTFLSTDVIEMNEMAIDSFDIDKIYVEPLFFQTGYLTVKEVCHNTYGVTYILDVPNMEVREALYTNIVAQLTETNDIVASSAYLQIRRALEAGDLEKILTQMRSLFSSIPYNLHIKQEAYYHSIFYSIMNMLGFNITAEVSTARGRIDATFELADKVYIMEFKYKDCAPDAPDEEKRALFDITLDEGMSQIESKGYADKYIGSGKTIYKVVFAFLGRDAIEMRSMKYWQP